MYTLYIYMLSSSVMSDSLQLNEPWPARLLCPWCSPGKNTGVGCHAFLQGILPTQGSNPCLLVSCIGGSALAPSGRHIYIYIYISMRMSGECMLLGSVSSQQRFGVMDIKALSVSQLLGLGQTMLWLSGLERTVL